MATSPDRVDVAVIGGGAVGVSVAYALAARGVGVTVLERRRIGSGASAGSACMVCPSHSDRTASPSALRDGLRFLLDPKAPLKLRGRPSELAWVARFTAASLREEPAHVGTAVLRRLALRSTELHREWSDALGTGLVMHGTLNLWSGPRAAEHRAAVVDEVRSAGLAIEELDAAAIAALEPSARRATHAALATDDGHVDSLTFTQCVAAGARAAGATIVEDVDVVRIDAEGAGVRLTTTRGPVLADRVVVAAGHWSRRFAGDVGARIPITPAKGYHAEFAGAVADAGRPLYFSEAHCVATPLEGRLRIAGTLEIGTDPDEVDLRRVDALREAGQRYLDGVPDAPTSIWLGQRPLTADSMPMIGPLPHDPRLLLATGHGTLGITLAPGTGELIADHVTRGIAAEPTLAPDRFR